MGGTPSENDAQLYLAELLGEMGLEVHNWAMDLARITAQPDFPGMEVARNAGVGVLVYVCGWRERGGRE